MPLSIENPIALLLLLALPGLYLLGRGRLSLMSRWRGRAILATRLASMSAIILALSGASMPLRDGSLSVAFLIDESGSMAPSTRAAAEEWVHKAIGQMKPTDRAAIIRFAAEPVVAKPLGDEKDYTLPPQQLQGDTNIPAALRLASGLLPATGMRRIVVLSDGWDTAGGVEQAARALPSGTMVDVVPWPAMDGQPELLVESLGLPSFIREGDGFDAAAIVAGSRPGTAQVTISVDGRQTGSWNVQLAAGANQVSMPQQPLSLGFHSVEVQLSGQNDTMQENNRAQGFVVVKPKGHVLVVEGHPNADGYLLRQLEGSGLQVDKLPASQLPIQMAQLLGYDGIVMDDVSGPSLSLDQMKTLQSYVRDQGRGLLVLGGKNSYGLGDYLSTPLEEMLPVTSEPPASKQRGDMALILLIDKSGSMDDSSNGVTKIAMAREAAIQATGELKPDDQIAVIAFDTDPQWIVPPQKVGNNLNAIRDRIASLDSSGGTDIYTALQTAFSTMQGLQATTKHITLLTDGQSWKGPYQILMQRMQQAHITLSTIGVGGDSDKDWLSELATLGQGRFYFTERFTDIPKIVFREVNAATRVAQVDGIVGPQFAAPSPILRGISKDGLPTLNGYVATKPKDGATLVLKSNQGDPLLAQWQYGLGRVVAWTSDTQGIWTSQWVTQPQYAHIWDQSVRWTMAPPIDRGLQLSAQVDGAHALLTAESVDINGQFVNLADTRANLWGPDGKQQSLTLRQVAPGRYQADLPADKTGLYKVEVHQARQGQQEVMESTGYEVPFSAEYRGLGSNDGLLKALAEDTGGRAVHDSAGIFSREGLPSIPGWEPMWPFLLGLALILLPVEVALRRIRHLPFRPDPIES
jgi:Ca-activated chloride channel homolog